MRVKRYALGGRLKTAARSTREIRGFDARLFKGEAHRL
jgi:hypothetical protein